MNVLTIRVGKDFSEEPFGRISSDGKFSGESFRENLLKPAILSYDVVEVDFDDVKNVITSSFLEEAFGGLIRNGLSYNLVMSKLRIVGKRREYAISIKKFIDRANDFVERNM